MAGNETPRPEFNPEELKRLFRLGTAALQYKVREVVSAVRHELNPDVRLSKHLKAKYDALILQGISPELAEKTVLEHAKELLKGVDEK